jgi:hypothetical protein
MKKKCLLFAIAAMAISVTNLESFAQDKSVDFTVGSNGIIYNITQCGDNNFYIVYGKMLLSKNASKNLMKLDKNLKQVWTTPVVFTGANKIDIFSYIKPSDSTTTSYIYGGEQFLQVSSDGTTKEKATLIPEKELENTAAVFTDSLGLNIITLIGEKKYTTGKMNWYMFSHDNLSMKKKTITIPLPTGIDKENESGWRINTVTSSGLYFDYVSYKNETDETSYPILSCNVVKVDYTGKPGSIINMDMELEKYTVIPARYSCNAANLYINMPLDITSTTVTTSSVNTYIRHHYTDNAFMKILIDEKNNTIYSFIAQNENLEVSNKGMPKSPMNQSTLIKKVTVKIFDLKGESINSSSIDIGTFSRGASDDYEYAANSIDLYLIPNKEGIVFKITNNDNGYIYALDKDAQLIEKNKISLFQRTSWTVHFNEDIFGVPYYSLKDFENSPYYLGVKSPVYQYFNKMDKKTKGNATYLSMKSAELLTEWNGKDDKVKLNLFYKD